MSDGAFPCSVVRGVPVVTVPEEVDFTTAGQLGAALKAAAGGHGQLVADMTRTRFCDLATLRALTAAHDCARASGGGLLVVTSSPLVLRTFALTGLDLVIATFASLETAVARACAGRVV